MAFNPDEFIQEGSSFNPDEFISGDTSSQKKKGIPLSSMKFTPDLPKDVSGGEQFVRMMKDPLYEFWGGKGEERRMAGRLGTKASTPAEEDITKRYGEEHPLQEFAAKTTGGMLNPLMALSGALMGKINISLEPVFQSLSSKGVKFVGRLAQAVSNVEAPADILARLKNMETGDPKAAEEVKSAVRKFGALMEAGPVAWQAGGLAREGISSAFRTPSMKRSWGRLGSLRKASEAIQAGEQADVMAPDTRAVLGRPGEHAETLAEQAGQRAAEITNQAKVAAEEAKTQTNEEIGKMAPRIKEQYQEPLDSLRSELGQRWADAVNQTIEKAANEPVDIQPVVDWIDKQLQSNVGRKDGLEALRERLTGVPRETSLMQLGKNTGVDLEKYRSAIESQAPELLPGKARSEVPMKEYIEISHDLKYPVTDAPSAAFQRKIYGELSQNLRGQKNPAIQNVADMMQEYSDAITGLDEARAYASSRGELQSSALNATQRGELGSQADVALANVPGAIEKIDVRSPGPSMKTKYETIRGAGKALSKERTQVVQRGEQEAEGALARGKKQIESEIADFPQSKEEMRKYLLGKSKTTTENPRLLEMAKKDPQLAEALARGDDFKVAEKIGDPLYKIVLDSLKSTLSMRPTVALERGLSRASYPAARTSLLVKYPGLEEWVKNADAAGLYRNKAWNQWMKGIWPLGLPASQAIPMIFRSPQKMEELKNRLEGK